MEKIDIKTLNGHLFTCDKCSKFHFEFNQLAIDFTSIKVLEDFLNFFNKMDGEMFEKMNQATSYVRKIHVPFPNTSIKMVLSQTDLIELKVLVRTFINDYKAAEEENRAIRELSIISEKQLN